MREGTLPPTLWLDKKYSSTDYGTNLLAHILGASNTFPFPKSVHTVADCLRVSQLEDGDVCLDFFAGSGTCGHAVIDLNREDNGNRKCILVEMGDHFDTVLFHVLDSLLMMALFCHLSIDDDSNGNTLRCLC